MLQIIPLRYVRAYSAVSSLRFGNACGWREAMSMHGLYCVPTPLSSRGMDFVTHRDASVLTMLFFFNDMHVTRGGA